MSLFLVVFYWVILPVGVFRLARWLFRWAQSLVLKGMLVVGTVGFFAWFLWVAVGEKMWLDHQVREMCAKDGGIKVYETVALPSERFDKSGNIYIPAKRYAKPEDEYYRESEQYYLQKGNPDQTGNPDVVKTITKIIRRYDGKVMGEAVYYIRRGGGFPGPWHPSSFSCPELLNFEPSIFKKQEKNL